MRKFQRAPILDETLAGAYLKLMAVSHIGRRMLSLREAAPILGFGLFYLREIVTDAARLERRLPTSLHERVPRFTKEGKRWMIYEPVLYAFLERRLRARGHLRDEV